MREEVGDVRGQNHHRSRMEKRLEVGGWTRKLGLGEWMWEVMMLKLHGVNAIGSGVMGVGE